MPDAHTIGQTVSKRKDAESGLKRRIRHITSIQVCNLTPFPGRDSLASALSQPAEQPQFTPQGHFSDDLDVTIGRKRGRKVSSTSIATSRSVHSDEEEKRSLLESRGRRTSGQKVNFEPGSLGSGSSLSGRTNAAFSPPSRSRRSRTASFGSTKSISIGTLKANSVRGHSMTRTSSIFSDNSQSTLENVINSRLLETFIAVTVVPDSPVLGEGSFAISAPPTPKMAKDKESISQFHQKRSPHTNGTLPRTAPRPSQPESNPNSSRRNTLGPGRSNAPPPLHVKSMSTSMSRSSSTSRSSSKLGSPTTPIKKSPSMGTPIPTPSKFERPQPAVPDFLSPVHPPSTNPAFVFDSDPKRSFAPWTDLSASVMQIDIWGRTQSPAGLSNGKGKAKEPPSNPLGNPEWKLLGHWNVNLSKLVPLLPEANDQIPQLPSNSLLVTLTPGRKFYLPTEAPLSRGPSISQGYTSNPESAPRLSAQELSEKASDDRGADAPRLSRRRHRAQMGDNPDLNKESAKTPSWHDIFTLVTLQSHLVDTENVLADIVTKIDATIEGDPVSSLKREVSQRQASLDILHANRAKVVDGSNDLRLEIDHRRQQLRERREIIALAREQHAIEVESYALCEQEVTQEQARLASLQSHFVPIRTTLLSTLSSIFPIELLSPPDLLYTILDVPLPIPSSPNDPAPPLSLLNHKNVNEEAVATALGYVAQVVHLLAVYLGKGLVYPVTCVGSRSLIRDNISAMVGPRMFPLFSKGVDTYRFEYGVFLLNKDIELLMADRDLRALDMRHTLPNLKNLLLTLTNGEGAPLRFSRSLDSPVSAISGLETPPRPSSPSETTAITPKTNTNLELPVVTEGFTPPTSGASTPIAGPSEAPKRVPSRASAFLALPSLSGFGFMRSRYPSSSSPKPEVEESHPNGDTGDSSKSGEMMEDDDDRKTINAVAMMGDTSTSATITTTTREDSASSEDVPPDTTPTLRSDAKKVSVEKLVGKEDTILPSSPITHVNAG
ncbi:hypothetical protein BDN72DRAFT_873255 [Pluteus cervinus]|uniref:Uncharacterized protein n=1 Tax=Pluteus cervinus TaxID=181527 RepID=A0ACD3BG92_9AGAR|nr:hypothetical protein BDN72DRAFT_873255 [Pluteus cervinus]